MLLWQVHPVRASMFRRLHRGSIERPGPPRCHVSSTTTCEHAAALKHPRVPCGEYLTGPSRGTRPSLSVYCNPTNVNPRHLTEDWTLEIRQRRMEVEYRVESDLAQEPRPELPGSQVSVANVASQQPRSANERCPVWSIVWSDSDRSKRRTRFLRFMLDGRATGPRPRAPDPFRAGHQPQSTRRYVGSGWDGADRCMVAPKWCVAEWRRPRVPCQVRPKTC